MKWIVQLLVGSFSMLAVAQNAHTECKIEDWVSYVNPLMGSESDFNLSTGNTYPAIAMPWGMNFWTPQTGKMGDGWTYSYDARQIRGFKQTHQPSPWINDYGQFSIMPVIGNKINEEERKSWFSHKAEIATPYYYGVYLADYDIYSEIAPTERAAIFQFTFPQSDSASVIIDAFDNGSYVKVDGNRIVGYTTRNSGGVPNNFKNYFVVELPENVSNVTLWSGEGELVSGNELSDNHVGAIVRFKKTTKGQKVPMRVASSFVSYEQALLNLNELGNLSFEKVKEKGKSRWNEVLGRIAIDAPLDVKRTFYSCLYRSTLFPRKFYEIDAQGNIKHYSPYNGDICNGYLYTDTGFWDTFRCLFPLLNLVYPDVNAEIQAGLLNVYNESGFLPEWASPGHRDCMVGNNSASVVSDAILKEVTPRNLWQPLYDAMIATANKHHPSVGSMGRMGVEYYNELGYVPCDVKINENVARTLEYAYDDWCISQVGQKLNAPKKEINLYKQRSQNWRNVFDTSCNFMRGKKKDGTFSEPFNPLKWGGDFTEGNSWHYTWSVFHDVKGLIAAMGGNERFVSKLDSVFTMPPLYDCSYYGFPIHEIREMQIMNMGNYAHGNQPIQHMIYLYDYAGQPRKAQYWIREVMDKMYKPTPDGYCGDEDNGQTSAWYVFSALGFYPVCPCAPEYAIGTPLVQSAVLTLQNGKELRFSAKDSDTKRYIHSVTFNQTPLTTPFFNYDELIKGGVITYDME